MGGWGRGLEAESGELGRADGLTLRCSHQLAPLPFSKAIGEITSDDNTSTVRDDSSTGERERGIDTEIERER